MGERQRPWGLIVATVAAGCLVAGVTIGFVLDRGIRPADRIAAVDPSKDLRGSYTAISVALRVPVSDVEGHCELASRRIRASKHDWSPGDVASFILKVIDCRMEAKNGLPDKSELERLAGGAMQEGSIGKTPDEVARKACEAIMSGKF